MNAHITQFHTDVAASVRRKRAAQNFARVRPFEGSQVIELRRNPPRAALVMIWRPNPISGRPEFHWAEERGSADDESVSCRAPLARVA
jgi:hypothetical protein